MRKYIFNITSLFLFISIWNCELIAQEKIVKKYFSQLGIEVLSEKKAPIFLLKTIDGSPISLDNYKGQILIIHFWATWCKPCREEMPGLEQLFRQMQGKPVTVLGISIDDEKTSEKIPHAVEEMGLTFPIALRTSGKITDTYWTWGIPVSYIIDAEGNILGRITGSRDWENEKMKELIYLLLEKK